MPRALRRGTGEGAKLRRSRVPSPIHTIPPPLASGVLCRLIAVGRLSTLGDLSAVRRPAPFYWRVCGPVVGSSPGPVVWGEGVSQPGAGHRLRPPQTGEPELSRVFLQSPPAGISHDATRRFVCCVTCFVACARDATGRKSRSFRGEWRWKTCSVGDFFGRTRICITNKSKYVP